MVGTSNNSRFCRSRWRWSNRLTSGYGLPDPFCRLACHGETISHNAAQTPHATNSGGRGRDPLQLHQSVYVVAEVHHADLELRPRHADRAHNLATHRVLLMAEHVLDAGAHL